MTDVVGPGTLKLVSGWSPSRSLDRMIKATLAMHVEASDVRQLSAGLFAIYTDAQPEDVRSWIADTVSGEESTLVVEFERWSSHGPGVNQAWLLRRGH